MVTYKIKTEFIELFKLLKVTNICESGGEAKHMIAEGHVRVDGIKELRKACKIRTGQMVEFDNKKILVE